MGSSDRYSAAHPRKGTGRRGRSRCAESPPFGSLPWYTGNRRANPRRTPSLRPIPENYASISLLFPIATHLGEDDDVDADDGFGLVVRYRG